MAFSSKSNKHNLKSKYFNFHQTDREQNLVNSLIKEAIHINGLDMIYIPRKYVNLDTIYGEDVLSSFEKTFEMVFYVDSEESYGGTSRFLGDWGFDIQDQVKLALSIDVFEDVVVNSAENNFNIKIPRSGDLIYNNIFNRLFEIVDVARNHVFFQLGKRYTYLITAELFDFSNEKLNTGLSEIDLKNSGIISRKLEVTLKTTPIEDYQVGEMVYIGPNLPLADFYGTVISYNKQTRKIVITDEYGDLEANKVLVGETSDVSSEIKSWISIKKIDDGLKDNAKIETEANEVIYRDPKDDFGYEY